MYAIIFLILSTVLTITYYRVNQCSGFSELLGCFVMNLLTQMTIIIMFYLVYTLYMLKPL